VPWSKAVARRAIHHTIAQQLKTLYQVPQNLPKGMLALLKELNERHEEE
jgi:hypothetical protein